MRKVSALGILACALLACRTQVVNLGNNDGGAGSVASGGSSGSPATWTGYIEGYHLPSGSDAVTIVLATKSDGSLTGTVTFGDKPPPPPPTDPSVGYPPSTNDASAIYSHAGPLTVESIEGFHYTAQNPVVSTDGSRVQLDVATYELWKSWCELQTSYSWAGVGSGPQYGCDQGPNFQQSGTTFQCMVGDTSGTTYTPIDCGKAQICGESVCTCSSTSCTVNTSNTDLHFDLQLKGDTLEGAASTSGVSLCCPQGTMAATTTPPLDGHALIFARSP